MAAARVGSPDRMNSLLKLPLRALELASVPARAVAGKVVEVVHGVVAGREHAAPPAPPKPPPAPPAPPAATRPKPAPPRKAAAAPTPPPAPKKPAAAAKKPAVPATKATAAAKKPSPKAIRRAARHEPTPGEAAAIRTQRREEEQAAGGEGGVGAEIHVAAPWDGYDAMTEDQVLDRLTGAESATRAAVRFYEGMNGGRRQILLATEEPVPLP